MRHVLLKLCRLLQTNRKIILISEKCIADTFTYIQITFCFDFNSNNKNESWCLCVMPDQFQFLNDIRLFILFWLHFESSREGILFEKTHNQLVQTTRRKFFEFFTLGFIIFCLYSFVHISFTLVRSKVSFRNLKVINLKHCLPLKPNHCCSTK